MATGGGSLSICSEHFYDFSCTPCAKDGKYVEAVRYCVDCSERFCSSCLKDHNKFEIMRHHDLLDEAGMNALGPIALPALPRQKCTLHHGKTLEMYCGTHDFVYCTVCIALDHKSCSGIDDVPKVAKEITKSQEFQEVKARINALEQDLQMLKKGRNLDLRGIEKQKKKIQASITDYRKEINKILDNLEKSTIKELDKCFKKKEDQINEDLSSLDKLLSHVGQQVKDLQTAKDVNDSQLFINMKEAKQSIPEGEVVICKVEKSLGKETLDISINTDIAKSYSKLTSLGEITEQRHIQSASLVCQYNVQSSDEKKTSNITDVCFMPDDSILITDFQNTKLKLLDPSYNVISECSLSSDPYAVCSIGPTEVATTLPHETKIQFASITNTTITPTKSFEVGGRCTAIAYNNGELYVVVGGDFIYLPFNKAPGQVLVYDKVGTLLQTFLYDSQKKQMFISAHHIVVSLCGNKLHIADMDKGIITLDKEGNNFKLQASIDLELLHAFGICVRENSSCGHRSSNVILIDKDGHKQVELLSAKNGVNRPCSLSYDIRHNRLVVTMQNCKYISVYILE